MRCEIEMYDNNLDISVMGFVYAIFLFPPSWMPRVDEIAFDIKVGWKLCRYVLQIMHMKSCAASGKMTLFNVTVLRKRNMLILF